MCKEGSSEENRMFVDEYQREDFDKQMKAAHEDAVLAKVIKNE